MQATNKLNRYSVYGAHSGAKITHVIIDDLSPINDFEHDRKTKGRKLNKTKRGNAQKRNWEAL